MIEENNIRTLYVGNIDASVDEKLLSTLFSGMGLEDCKIIREPDNDPYALIEFTNQQCAATALAAMDKKLLDDKEMEVGWATGLGIQSNLDPSDHHHHIFVGDPSPKVEKKRLDSSDEVGCFLHIGDKTFPIKRKLVIGSGRYCDVRIACCKLSKLHASITLNGFGVSVHDLWSQHKTFVNGIESKPLKQYLLLKDSTLRFGNVEATLTLVPDYFARQPISSIRAMNRFKQFEEAKKYEKDNSKISPTNCTVYCGGLTNAITDDLIRKTFSQFGTIQDVEVFKDEGSAFITFTTKEAATNAIEVTHNTEVNGRIVKCFWRKEKDNLVSLEPISDQKPQQSGILHIGDMTIPVGDTIVTIGSARSCTVRIPCCELPEVHAWIERVDSRLVMVPVSTQQKTFVDGVRIESVWPYSLTKDSTVQFGNVKGTFTTDPEFFESLPKPLPETSNLALDDENWENFINDYSDTLHHVTRLMSDCRDKTHDRGVIETFCENITRV